MYPGTSPLYIKVGQISGLSKNGSWALVDARNFFFFDLLIEGMHRKLCKCVNRRKPRKYKTGSNLWFIKKWVMGPS